MLFSVDFAHAAKCIYEYVIRTTEYIIRMKKFSIRMKIF